VFFSNRSGGMLKVGHKWKNHDIPSQDRGRMKAAKFPRAEEKTKEKWDKIK